MNIYKVIRQGRTGYNEYSGFVVAADSKSECLDIIVDQCGEFYRTESYDYEMVSDTTFLTEAGIILADFNAG